MPASSSAASTLGFVQMMAAALVPQLPLAWAPPAGFYRQPALTAPFQIVAPPAVPALSQPSIGASIPLAPPFVSMAPPRVYTMPVVETVGCPGVVHYLWVPMIPLFF